MDPIILVTILFVLFFTAAFFAWFSIHKSKEKERLLLLEKGVSPSELPSRSTFNFPWLKIGCLITSAVIGLILGMLLESVHEIALLLGPLLFAGIGLIIAHYADKPNE